MQAANLSTIEETEFRLLLEGVLNCYGYDFRDYAEGPLRRRIWEAVEADGARTLTGYLEKLLHEPAAMDQFLVALCARETGLFDDPPFWAALRQAVVPTLRTYPSIQVWIPACGRGEDAYALAILLHEAGLAERARIYATDLSEKVLRAAHEGIFPADRIDHYSEQYLKGGGTAAFADYYRIDEGQAAFAPFLRDRIVFAEHSLATDGPFNEFQVVLCRQALAEFDAWLQERVCALFVQSLSRFGILGLGLHESPKLPPGEGGALEGVPGVANLYRKVK